ncbi:carbonic anhydrase [Pseudonocardiaceae bacterium YIM PH 21723]|nr:carbonic anhydrase [Pseudonocardiaceae bacterium YIM PH 21723]
MQEAARRFHIGRDSDTAAALAAGQQPTTMFITCSDSRIVPSQLLGTEPGQLFELRTAGNIVPPYLADGAAGEAATIEYAVQVLQVEDIVVCGHSHCGAVGALTKLTHGGEALSGLPSVRRWLETTESSGPASALTRQSLRGQEHGSALQDEGRQHVVAQLDRLSEYPFIAERVAAGSLTMHGWFYEVDSGAVWTRGPEAFVRL